MVDHLKTSSLLLEENEGFVKMHDIIRDVALWIASKGEHIFMVKVGMGLTKWPNHQGLDECKAISLIANEIKVFPDNLVCPKLEILLLNNFYHGSEICEIFFKEMKALKVMTLVKIKLSLKSLQSLSNLVTLQLINCELRDISSLKKLAKFKILSLQDFVFDESLEELKELSGLKMLDLRCSYLESIPFDVMPRLSQLEELHIIIERTEPRLPPLQESHIIIKRSEEQEVEGTSVERSNANLCMLGKPDYLTNVERSNVNLCKLSKLDCLTRLSLRIAGCQRLPKDFVLPKTLLKHDIRVNYKGPSKSHPKSSSLRIEDIEGTSLFAFKALYENVEYLKLKKIMGCYENIVPSIDDTGLNELKRLSLEDIQEVECIIDMTQEHVPSTAFSNLMRLHLHALRNLRNIWKGPTQQVSLQSLTVVEVIWCDKLRYVFTLNLARSLLQLQQLSVKSCSRLEHIVEIKAEENVGAGGGNDVLLPKLRKLELEGAEKLINFCSENYTSTWPVLQELVLDETPSLGVELGASMQTARQTLRELRIRKESEKFCNAVLPQLKNNFENLDVLRISRCREVQVIFQLDQQFSLPNLKEIELYGLEDLEWLYKGPTHLLSLPNLQQVKVHSCKRLRQLLSSTVLLQLKKIVIEDCGELEQLMNEDDREDRVQLPLFPNLSSIHVRSCDKLKTLFPVTIAPLGLQQLPQLKELTLDRLDSLVNFCPSGYHLIFPSLSWLKVEECPKITTRFSVDQNGSVHAQAEVEHSPPETDRAIFCMNSDNIRQTLPPYIGK